MEARNGAVVCVRTPGTYTLTLEGSTLIICGSGQFTIQGSIRNNSKIYVNSGATLNIGQFDSNTQIYNRGTAVVNSDVNINGSGRILNVGTMQINGSFGIDAPFDNLGLVTVSSELRLNGSARVTLGENSLLKTNRVSTIDAQVFGCGGCLHSVQKMEVANIINNSQGKILTPVDNLVYVCAQNGFGDIFGNTGKSGGAFLQSGCTECSATPPVTPPDLQVSIQGNTSICAGTSTTLTAGVSGNGNFSYEWKKINENTIIGTNASIVVNPAIATNYIVTVKDNNTQQTGSATVTVNLKPEAECSTPPDLDVSIQGNTSICAGASTTLTAGVSGNGNFSYEWKKINENTIIGTNTSIVVNPVVSTTYIVTVTDSNTRQTGSATVAVTVKPAAECEPPVISPCAADPGDKSCENCTPLTGSGTNINTGMTYCISTPGTYSMNLRI